MPGETRTDVLYEALTGREVRTVQQVAAKMGFHPRTIERLCVKTFARSAKRVLREQRLLRSLASIDREPRSKLSAHLDLGYADHPHFTRECRLLLGTTPRALRASDGLRAAMTRLSLQPRPDDCDPTASQERRAEAKV